MSDALTEALRGGSWSILLRHAERPPIPPGEFGAELSITDAGRKAAERLGRRIGSKLRGLVSSPVLRCVQTADAIRRGAGVDVTIERDTRLGAPGVWVEDQAIAGRLFLEHGIQSVLTRQIAGEALPGMRSLDVGAAKLLKLLQSEFDHADGVVLYVSHDSVMAPFLAYALERSELSEVLPACLEPAAVELAPTAPRLDWRGLFHASDAWWETVPTPRTQRT